MSPAHQSVRGRFSVEVETRYNPDNLRRPNRQRKQNSSNDFEHQTDANKPSTHTFVSCGWHNEMVNGKSNAMTLKIDNAGRLVIPKPLRDRMRLEPGADLEVEETAEGLLLRRISQKPSLIEQNGLLIHIGKPPKSFDWERIIEDEREERTRDVAGL
jgi:AbrB family looped-hinge helix DNA binding protein